MARERELGMSSLARVSLHESMSKRREDELGLEMSFYQIPSTVHGWKVIIRSWKAIVFEVAPRHHVAAPGRFLIAAMLQTLS